ncbi:hypothetical protein GCM10022291_15450 [Postechiella marina]|uniref:Phytanoyl-CoA dioxygenase n=1 Tax=Postechiella marina TaxID=943941 RepID=A0ABP8C793_9FLAO
MASSILKLKEIASSIILSSSEEDVEFAVQSLLEFYNTFSFNKLDEKDIPLDYGYALSAKHAADCIKDYKRTVAFIKGTYQGILSSLNKFSGETINILYAGSGPYAPLIIPLLSLFKDDNKLKVTILDVNSSSVKSVKSIIDKLEFQNFIDDVLVADAITYQYSKVKKLHIVITETMFHALTREPQVAITENLKLQITKGGYLIPEKIEIKMGYSFFSKEPFLNQYKDIYTISNSNKSINRDGMISLFELKNTSSSIFENFIFESSWIQLPQNIQDTPDVCIFTTINIFKDIKLHDSDSLITNPYCLGSLYNLKEKGFSKFKVRYSIKKDPSWTILT